MEKTKKLTIQDFFAENNGGKTPSESVMSGETFTAHQLIEFAKAWQNRSKSKKKKEVDPCYTKFIAIWNKYFPGLLEFPRDGRHFKSMIVKTEDLLKSKQKEVNEESKCNTFEFILNWCKQNNHWVSGEPAGVFDSKFKSVVYKMQFGKQKSNFNTQNSAERAFSSYSR